MKRIICIAAALVLIAALISGCSCSGSAEKTGSDTPSETVKVIETTPDGGTVEQDPEGNTITKDKKGNIVSVSDKNGESVDTDKYISTHEFATGSAPAGSDTSDSSSKSGGSGSGNSKSSGNSSSKSSGKSSSSEGAEEEIPSAIGGDVDEDEDDMPVF